MKIMKYTDLIKGFFLFEGKLYFKSTHKEIKIKCRVENGEFLNKLCKEIISSSAEIEVLEEEDYFKFKVKDLAQKMLS